MAQTKERARAWRKENPDKLKAYYETAYAKHRDKMLEKARAYRAANKEILAARKKIAWAEGEAKKSRARLLKKLYSLTPDCVDGMLIAQQGRCDVCCQPLVDFKVDHCHTTGKVRSLLCSPCNTGLGHFHDNPERLEAAATYLRKHK